MGVEYIVRGAVMCCSCGSCPSNIKIPISHGSYVENVPILNKTDNTTANISPFGICILTKKPCAVSPGKWTDVKEDKLIAGNPALTTNSIMFTNCGGIIRFITSGQ